MNALTLAGAAATMTSQQIAELVDKRHDNVKRTIETLVTQGVIESPQVEEIPTATKPMTVYRFAGEQGKRDSIVVVAQLSPQMTARLVDRWQELEKQAALAQFDIPKTMPDALRLAAEALEGKAVAEAKVQQLTHKVESDAPKVEVFERLCAADGSLCMRDAAKALQVRPIDLKNLLIANRWIYGRPGHTGWLGYQDRLQQGVLLHKVSTFVAADGTERVTEQVRVTPKGLTKLAQMLQQSQSRAA